MKNYAGAISRGYRSPAVCTAILSINCRVWADGFTTKRTFEDFCGPVIGLPEIPYSSKKVLNPASSVQCHGPVEMGGGIFFAW